MTSSLARLTSWTQVSRRLSGIAMLAGLISGCTPLMLDNTPAEEHWQQVTYWPLELPTPQADDHFSHRPASDDQRLAAGDRVNVRVAGSELFDGS